MNSVKKVFFVYFILISIVSVFSVGIYDDFGNYKYYVNKANPIIDINITAGSKALLIEKGVLTVNDQETAYTIEESNKYLNLFNTQRYSFEILEDISLANKIGFKLFVYSSSDGKAVVPNGDPIDFSMIFDNTPAQITNIKNSLSSNRELVFTFSEPISKLVVDMGGQKKEFNAIVDSKVKSGNSFTADLSDFSFDSEIYDFTFEFWDLAENYNSDSRQLFVHSDNLTISLLTIQDDSSLSYNYNKKYPSFFNKTIYAKSSSFSLKLKTNKPANCFFTSSLLSFKSFGQILEKTAFSTTDNLIHTIGISDLDKKIWVACQNKNNEEEIVYLSEELNIGKDLINIKVYVPNPELSILNSEPKALVTNIPFDLFVDTNVRALCFYSFDNSENEVMISSDFKKFKIEGVDAQVGSYPLKFDCFDLLNNKKSVSHNINVDPSLGVRVVDYTPKYTGSNQARVQISLSEANNVICKFGKNRVSPSDFNTLSSINGSDYTRIFTVTGLVQGPNKFFVYCNKDDAITLSEIEIVSDTKGVVLSNLSFVNGKYKSDFVGSNKEIEIDFDVVSLVPIQKYYVEIFLGNKTVKESFSGKNSKTFKGNFDGATKLKLIGSNELGKNGSIEKQIKFDFIAPAITIVNKGNIKELICTDIGSGCAEVFYGMSMTNIDCRPNKLYGKNSSIDVTGKNYLCVEAYDYVSLRTFKLEALNNSVDSDFAFNDTLPEFNQTENMSEIPVVEDFEDDLEPLPDNSGDYIVPETDNTGTIILIGAIALILAGIGGGGYYAYKKGYLNKELEKLGIKIPKTSSGGSSTVSQPKFDNRNISRVSKEDLRKSSYDDHLKKVNKFIDNKMSKSDDMFSNFDKSDSEDVLGSNAIDPRYKKKGSKDISKENFDEFYEKSGNTSVEGLNTKSVEREAEEFEEFYKKKRDVDIKSKTSSKK